MGYIVRRRARFHALCGSDVNLPYGTRVEQRGRDLFCQGKQLCWATSKIAHDYFSWNGDGKGEERGALVGAILAKLANFDRRKGWSASWEKEWNANWAKVWQDPLCQRYKRPDHEEQWHWNHDFYGAPVEDLRKIASLVGAKT